MTHNELVHDLCTQDSIVVQNFAELMRFVLDGKRKLSTTVGLTSMFLSGLMLIWHLALI